MPLTASATRSRRSASQRPRTRAHRVVVGAQRPRLANLPEWTSTSGDTAVELALLAGIDLDDWQRWTLQHTLGERPDGKWSALTVGLTVGRQNGKNEIMAAAELCGLFVLDEWRILHTAHLLSAVTTQYERMLHAIRGSENPEVAKRYRRSNSSPGMQEIELTTGQKIIFRTRQGSKTGRSQTLRRIMHDECMYISDAQVNAIAPTMAALSMDGNVQTWYVGSPPDVEEADHDGLPFARVRQQALGGAERIFYAEWSVEGEDPDNVPEPWRHDLGRIGQANPGLGIRISPEWVEHERDSEMSRRGFNRERLGIGAWPDPSEDAGRVIDAAEWAECACHDSAKRIVAGKSFGVDVSPSETWGSISVAGARDDGLQHIALVDRHRGTGWMVERCAQLSSQYRGAEFVVDRGGPAAFLIDALKEAGVRVLEADASDYATACAEFVTSISERTSRYPHPQPELDEAVRDARKQPLGDRWKWSRRNSTSADITPLVSATLARWRAVRCAKKRRARVINPYDYVR